MKFKHTENEKIKSTDGRDFWISRSVAVVMHVLIEYGGGVKVITVKRGETAHNFVDHWCLPCGFLDWDESGPQACKREFWEETGINLDEVISGAKQVVYNGLESEPWKVVTEPELDGMQNVCLHYGVYLKYDSSNFPYDLNFCNSETAAVALDGIHVFLKKQVAFNHDERIKDFIKHIHPSWSYIDHDKMMKELIDKNTINDH